MTRMKCVILGVGWSLWSTAAVAQDVPNAATTAPNPSPSRSAQLLAALLLDAGSYSEQCVTPEELVGAVQAQLGGQTFVEPADPRVSLTIRVAIRKIVTPAGWQARVRTETKDGRVWGERELEVGGEDCHALDDQLVLITTLMSDPSLVPPATESEPPERTLAAQHSTDLLARQQPPDVDDGAVSVAPPAPERRWEASVEAAFAGALGLLPAVAAGARARLRVSPPWFWTARLSATIYYPQEVEVLDGSARFGLAQLGLDLCPVASGGGDTLGASLCAGANLGMLSVQSFDLDQVRSVRRWVLEGFVAVGLTTRLSDGWYAGGELTLGLPARRDTFAYTTAEGDRVALFEQGALSVAFSALLGHTL